MKRDAEKKLLLINGFSVSRTILGEFLSKKTTDSNIYLSYPLGVLTLAGWCRQELPNFQIQILDEMMNLHKHISNRSAEPVDNDNYIRRTLDQADFTPDFIGLSIICSNGHNSCLDIARLCKEKWPNCVIVAGGMHATTFTHRIIIDPNIDYAIRGTGDIAFIELLKNLVKEKNPDSIEGVVSDLKNIHKFALPLDDLNKIPALPYDLIDMEYLIKNDSTSPVKEAETRVGTVFMSRGCPFGCAFCSADQIHGKKVAFIDVEKIIENIEFLINTYQINTVCVMDDLFGANKKYFNDFFRLKKEKKLKFRIVIPGGLNINIFDEEMIDILIENGMEAINFPLESGSKYVQDNIIKKRVDLAKAQRLISYTQKKGIFTGVNVIFGFPGETRKLVDETYEYLKKLPADWIAFFLAYPYPGTEMTNILLNRGDLTENKLMETWELSTQSFKQRPFDTKEFAGGELSALVYDFNIELNFFYNYNLRTKNYLKMIKKLDKIIERFPFHVVALACRAKCFHELDNRGETEKDIQMILNLRKTNTESQKMYNKYNQLILKTLDFASDLI